MEGARDPARRNINLCANGGVRVIVPLVARVTVSMRRLRCSYCVQYSMVYAGKHARRRRSRFVVVLDRLRRLHQSDAREGGRGVCFALHG